MSALSFPNRPRPNLRNIGMTIAAGCALVVLGLVCGKVATSHYEKLALTAGIGLPALGGLGVLVFRRPAWGVVGLAVTLVAIPAYAAPVKLHFVMHPALIISVVLAVALVLRAVAGRKSRLSGLDVCVMLFVGAIVVAVLLGPRSWKEATSQLWVWVLPYIGGRMIATSQPLMRTFAKSIVLAGTALTPFAIAEAIGLGNPFFGLGTGPAGALWAHADVRPGESFRVETSFGHPIAYSMFIAAAVVFALVLLGGARTRRARLLYAGSIGALLVNEALTLSRAGFVSLGVALLLLAAGRRRGAAGRVARRAIVAGVAAVIALAVVFPSVAAVPLSLVGLQSDTSGTSTSSALNSTASFRGGLYTAAFHAGVGSLFGNKTSKLAGTVQIHNQSVDSEYLLLLDQYGAVVTLGFLLIVGALAVRSLSGREDEWATAFAVTAVGSAVALASVAFLNQQEYLVWLLIGLSAAPKPQRNPLVDPPALPHRSSGEPGTVRPRLPAVRERTNLEVVTAALRRRWWILLLCPLVAGGVAMVLAKQRPTNYTASGELLFQVPDFAKALFGVSLNYVSPDPNRQVKTNLALTQLPVIAQRTAASIGGLSASRVQADVKVSQLGRSDVYAITVTDRNPALVATIANTYARQYLDFRKQSDRARVSAVKALFDRELAQMTPAARQSGHGRTLQLRSDELALITALQTGEAELVTTARTPVAAAAASVKKPTEYGALVGLLIGIALVFWIGRRDRRVRDAASVEDAYGVPLLGTVSNEQAATLSGARSGRSEATADAFDLLRASLRYFNVNRDIRTLMVASAGAHEGRTTVALQLAIAEAISGTERVLLLEADLRRPSLAAALGEPPGPGLSEVLTRHAHLDDALRHVPVGRGPDGAPTDTAITVLPAGAVPPNSLELMESESMTWLLNTLTDRFDLVVIDSPPTSVVPDAIPLLARMSGVVVVARIGMSTREAARSLREQLAQAGADTLGVVAMSVPTTKAYRFRAPRWLRRPGPQRGTLAAP